jgi:hypothetical protein
VALIGTYYRTKIIMSSNTNDSKRQRDDVRQADGNGEGKRSRDNNDDKSEESSQPGYERYTNEELRELLREKDQSLREKDQSLREKDQSLREKDRRHKNHSFESLLAVEEGQFKLNGGNGFSHVNGNHIPATSEVVDFVLSNPDPAKIKMIIGGSRLLHEFVDQEYVEENELKFLCKNYGSEADICSFVAQAVKDAIKILEKEDDMVREDELETKLERSLFGCRPDIMVVRNRDGVGLVAIEVKQPVLDNKTLAEFPKVIGHAYDHAAAMNAFGQGTGIVMISSFTESNICSLNESDLICTEGSQRKEAATSSKLKINGAPPAISHTQSPPQYKVPFVHSLAPAVSHDSSSAVSSAEASPAGSLASASSRSVQDTDSGPEEEAHCSLFIKESDEKRVLYQSKAYYSHQLVKLAYSAIKLAKKKYKESTQEIYELNHGKIYIFPKALRVVAGKKENYCWGKLFATLDNKITSQKNVSRCASFDRCSKEQSIDCNDLGSYYIIGSLGHGATSNVFQALDYKGKQVALKVYVKNIIDGGEMLETEKFEQVASEATSREVDLLGKFYPFLKGEVKAEKIFGMHCVVMPFFKPVEKAKREETLKDIETVLKGPFLTYNLKYREDDFRWRHVGSFQDTEGEEHCVLYDLADLENSENSEERGDSFFDRLIEKWRGRMDPEPENRNGVFVKKE